MRIPLPFWAIETRNNEPFLEGVAWKYVSIDQFLFWLGSVLISLPSPNSFQSFRYFLKATEWARKYGIRINLDLHALPGSQNGFNHSGRLGYINFLQGVMGIANAQRGLEYIRILTEFISQPEYSHIALWGFMNEAKLKDIGEDILSHLYVFLLSLPIFMINPVLTFVSFYPISYLETHDMIRNITGNGAGKGPYISFHDGFQGTSHWAGYMPGADRLILDSHPYLCFVDQDTDPLSAQLKKPCGAWGQSFNGSLSNFGITIAGEWALSFNDCGKWLNGVGTGSRWEGTFDGYTGPTGGDCDEWTDYANYDNQTRQEIYKFAQSSMDALPHWFFWTWKIGNRFVSLTSLTYLEFG